MNYLSYDELLQHIIDLRLQEDEKAWEFAAACAVALEKFQAKPGDIGSQVGYSGKHIKNMSTAFLTFPVEEDRAIELSISHHIACLKADDPKSWLDRAVQEQWSVRQLKQALAGQKEKDEEKEAERAWAKIEKILEAGGPGAALLRQKIRGVADKANG